MSFQVKHADILIRCARKELSIQIKHADILIRCARKSFLAILRKVDALVVQKVTYLRRQVTLGFTADDIKNDVSLCTLDVNVKN